MKSLVSLFLCCITLLCLAACGGSETSMTYYQTKQYREYDTGDINLTAYVYDDAWVIQSTQNYLNGVFSSGVEYSYNEDATVVTVTTTSSIYNPTVSEIHREFDESGRVVRAVSYREGTMEGSTEYTYDGEGRERKAVTVGPGGDVVSTLLYDYDKNGNLIASVTETEAYSRRVEHSYDRKNRIVATKEFRSGELVHQINYTWDGNTQYGSVLAANEQITGETVAVYDDAGNLLMEEQYDSLGALRYRTCYEYTGADGNISSGIPQS